MSSSIRTAAAPVPTPLPIKVDPDTGAIQVPNIGVPRPADATADFSFDVPTRFTGIVPKVQASLEKIGQLAGVQVKQELKDFGFRAGDNLITGSVAGSQAGVTQAMQAIRDLAVQFT